ncbi:hypothetical protein LUZ60_009552 [Juncus effusus]|nr:hypothetical protein LUZ60_009552 [Juncus effusus]
MAMEKKVPKGFVPILVGKEKEMEKIMVHTKLFKNPIFQILLEMAVDEFGYEQRGILRIPCAVEQFRRVLDALKNGKS